MPRHREESNTVAVRIIGGTLRGRKLEVPSALGLRPTPDRVRETLFNWLQRYSAGAHCLDLFAGSGGLGIEAYSRGAGLVVAIEQNSKVFQVLQKRTVEWNLDKHYKVLKADALQWLSNWSGESFDVIFLDPPFQKQYLPRLISLIQEKGCLKADGLLYIERPLEQSLPDSLEMLKEQKAGGLYYGLYKLRAL